MRRPESWALPWRWTACVVVVVMVVSYLPRLSAARMGMREGTKQKRVRGPDTGMAGQQPSYQVGALRVAMLQVVETRQDYMLLNSLQCSVHRQAARRTWADAAVAFFVVIRSEGGRPWRQGWTAGCNAEGAGVGLVAAAGGLWKVAGCEGFCQGKGFANSVRAAAHPQRNGGRLDTKGRHGDLSVTPRHTVSPDLLSSVQAAQRRQPHKAPPSRLRRLTFVGRTRGGRESGSPLLP